MTNELSLPPITLHSKDHNDLAILATIALRSGRPGARFLLKELRRASLCAVDALPAHVVSISARVTYRLAEASPPVTCTLVLPDEVGRFPDGLSVLTPLGTALLGLHVGDRMPFRFGDGRASEVRVVGVECSRVGGVNSKSALDRRLDQALDQTFPASDPVSVVCTT
jgi:transcription elongation GreA/GreB family factor